MFFAKGTLIAKEWVLTAAHCVEHKTRQDFLVRVGTRCQHTPDDTEKGTQQLQQQQQQQQQPRKQPQPQQQVTRLRLFFFYF